jgi:uncharacterized protein GlcG (DUF336 family)
MITHLNVPTISYGYAADIVAKALDAAERAGVRAIVTVVDPALALVAFGRADGATPHSVETSRRKAMTAASTRKPSSALNPDLATALEHGTGGILTRVKGGVPIVVDGVTIGGLGVAGGLPDQDEAIALEVLAALTGAEGAAR